MFTILKKLSFPHYFIFTLVLFPIISRIGIPINSYFVYLLYDYIMIIYLLWYKRNRFKVFNNKEYNIIRFFLLWSLICIVRGIFVAENYWEYKSLSWGTLCLCLPLFCYIFENPYILQKTIKLWLKYILPIFLFILSWLININGYHFYIPIVLFISCFIPILPNKWKILFLLLIIIMLIGEIGARAQMLKAAAVLCIVIGISFRRIIPEFLLKVIHCSFFVIPIVLLFLGISGIYNVFQSNSEKYAGKYVEKKVVNGEETISDATADTRTFIYTEVIESAVRNNYLIFGRTPARGNDSMAFGEFTAEELKTGKFERYMNEVGNLNVFTWTGLIGLVLWSLIYFKSSYLAVYKSNNIYIKYLGLFIAFRFFLGWIEDVNNFNISGITVWMMIAMGFSVKFRNMNNIAFRKWFLKCLPY